MTMCLVNFQLKTHHKYKLILAANRDEFYARPTAQAHFWEDKPFILAGRDLLGMGTWLGITKQGRFATLTNIRHPGEQMDGKKSRGEILANYLSSDITPEHFLEQLIDEKDSYPGFNLLLGTPDHLCYFNNQQGYIEKVNQGTHGLSNHFLDTAWPKVVKGNQMLESYVKDRDVINPDRLFDMLAHSEEAALEDLPDTGVAVELEKKLSPLFIKTPDYGTRSSTVLLVDYNDHVHFIERTYKNGRFYGEVDYAFDIDR